MAELIYETMDQRGPCPVCGGHGQFVGHTSKTGQQVMRQCRECQGAGTYKISFLQGRLLVDHGLHPLHLGNHAITWKL